MKNIIIILSLLFISFKNNQKSNDNSRIIDQRVKKEINNSNLEAQESFLMILVNYPTRYIIIKKGCVMGEELN